MSSLRDLYQEVIFDHNRNPRNRGSLEQANRVAEGVNPLCGDQLKLYMLVDDEGVIRDVAFQGQGCAISTASASIMTETLKGKTEEEAHRCFEQFHAMVTGEGDGADMGKLEVLAGVRQYPTRVKCATLAWHTAEAALRQKHERVTTE